MARFCRDLITVTRSCPAVATAYRNWKLACESFRTSEQQDIELKLQQLHDSKQELLGVLELPVTVYAIVREGAPPINYGVARLYDSLLLEALERNKCRVTNFWLENKIFHSITIELTDDSHVSTMPSTNELIIRGDGSLDHRVKFRPDSLVGCGAQDLRLSYLTIMDDVDFPEGLSAIAFYNCDFSTFNSERLPDSVEDIYITQCAIGEIILTDLPTSLTGVYLMRGPLGTSRATLSYEVRNAIFSLRDRGITVVEK